MKTMYKGIPFSPRATLTQEINGSATVIPVSDVNAFPEAPNLATIGTDDAAETILYSAKTENALSGCTRGVEGSAKTWSAGSIISRNFTSVEYGYIIDNVQQLFNEQEFTARINEEGHLIITLGTGTEIDCGNAKGDRGPTGATGSNGKDGADGEDGGYYQPAVDGSGNLTWTASKAGMPAVSGANIKGATGPAGANATINGVNALNIVEGDNITLEQSGSTLTISAEGGGIPVVNTSGTGAAYTATVPGVTELTNGLTFILIPHVTSTTTQPTLNVNGLGAKKLVRYPSVQNGTDGYNGGSSAGWFYIKCPIIVSYTTTGQLWVVLNNQKPMTSDVGVSINTNYTANQVRGISLQTSTPSSIPNGSIVGVYST